MPTLSVSVLPGETHSIGGGEIAVDGENNIIVRNIHGSNIVLNIGKFGEWHELNQTLQDYEEALSYLPGDRLVQRIKLEEKIEQQKKKISRFKQNVCNLAQTFSRIHINTERLLKAKQFFDDGKIKEAEGVLETELQTIYDEQSELLKKREDYEQDILPKLKHNSEEFLLLANARQLNYEVSNPFEAVCDLFERSIESFQTKENLFQYARFLTEHHELDKAFHYYSLYHERFQGDISPRELASFLSENAWLFSWSLKHDAALELFSYSVVLHVAEASKEDPVSLVLAAVAFSNLGIAYYLKEDYENALMSYKEAINILEQLPEDASQNQAVWDLRATIYLNSAVALEVKHKYDESDQYVEEAIEILCSLRSDNPYKYIPNLAKAYWLVGSLRCIQAEWDLASEYYEEAVALGRILAEYNPKAFSYDLANGLIKLAILYEQMGATHKAAPIYDEALTISRRLSEQNLQAYQLIRGNILMNLSLYYARTVPNRRRSIDFGVEATSILLALRRDLPHATEADFKCTLACLAHWGVNSDEVLRRVSLLRRKALTSASTQNSL